MRGLFELLVFWWRRLWARLLRQSLYVDAQRGSDANDGSRRRPLKTLEELDARTRGCVLNRDLRVVLRGNFANQKLSIHVNAPAHVVVTVEGLEGFWERRRRVARWRRARRVNNKVEREQMPATIGELSIEASVRMIGLDIRGRG